MVLSTNFYQLGKSKDRELDFQIAVQTYSTSRGAVYPGFVITEYFTGLPFSLMRNASPV
jgi:hypothetical protein